MRFPPPARALALAALVACSHPPPPRVRAAPPAPPLCDESIFVAEVDPASTLDFRPTRCTLRLAGWYAIDVALLEPPPAIFFLICHEDGASEKSLSLVYRGPPVGADDLPRLADPYHTGGREDMNTVSYASAAPRAAARYRFDKGSIRFYRRPRRVLDHAADAHAYVELGLDLRFEGGRRFRAALRMCPTWEHYGPVSDPIE